MYHLNSAQLSNDDTTSVAYWVQEMKEIPENNPVVLLQHAVQSQLQSFLGLLKQSQRA